MQKGDFACPRCAGEWFRIFTDGPRAFCDCPCGYYAEILTATGLTKTLDDKRSEALGISRYEPTHLVSQTEGETR